MRGCLHRRQPLRGRPAGEYSWSLILSVGRDATTGRQRQRWITFHGTKRQAEQCLAELTGEHYRGDFVEPTRMTLGNPWLDHWLANAVKPPRCAVGTHTLYAYVIAKHLKPVLGHIRLQTLTPLHCERYYSELKLAPRSVALHHSVLSTSLKAAVSAGLLRRNPATRATNKPKAGFTSSDSLHNVWAEAEARQFLAHLRAEANTQHLALFALALDASLRKGELIALQWADLQQNTLHVRRQRLHTGEVTLPKSRRARTLDLSEETVALLHA
jgi:integrase